MKLRFVMLAVVLPALALASVDGNSGLAPGSHAPEYSDYIYMNVVNSWQIDWAQQVLGIDIWEFEAAINVIFTSPYYDGELNTLDPYTGASAGTIPLDPGNYAAFGISWDNVLLPPTYMTNDWIQSSLYITDDWGATWVTETNPIGSAGRGMDFDGTDYWMSNSDIGVVRFQPGTGAELISLPEISSQIAGLTVFPSAGNLGIALTCYNTADMWFYSWDGSTMTYIGTAPCPASGASECYGLGYCEVSNTIFMSYEEAELNYICEFEFTIELALEQSTWGAIKSQF